MRTSNEIMNAMEAIISDAEGRELTDDEVRNYEDLEAELTTANRDLNIRQRHDAYRTPVPPDDAGRIEESPDDDDYTRAFHDYLITGRENADLISVRAQNEASGPSGGFLVPEGFRTKIVDRLLAFGGIGAEAETITTETGNPLPWVTVDDTANVGEILEEGGTFTQGADVTFGTANLGAYTYAAGAGSATPLKVSLELVQDANIDIESFVANKLAMRIGRIQATHLVTGTGVEQPLGLVTGITGVELEDDTAGVTYNDLVNYIHSVDPAYRELGNCIWAFNDQSLKTIKQIADSNGDPIWRPDTADLATGTGGGTLLGHRVRIDQAFVDIDVDDNTDNWGVFGDIRAGYVIRRVKAIALAVNPYSSMNNRQIEYSAWARMDATQQDTNAYIALTGETP